MNVPKHLDGERLDRALTMFLPEASLRHRRRLIESGAVRLDDRMVRPGVKIRAGQVLELRDPGAPEVPLGVDVLKREGEFAAVTKPAGVHSASVSGGGGPSVEAALPKLFPGESVILLNRLDFATSGFVLVAFSEASEDHFRALEASGVVQKEYLARVTGHMERRTVIRNCLDMADRKQVRVMAELAIDPARHTHAEPIAYDEAENTTLVRAIIARGARHQIRVHLASLGHAIVGDELYGAGEGDSLYLHHRSISFEGLSVQLEPDWDA